MKGLVQEDYVLYAAAAVDTPAFGSRRPSIVHGLKITPSRLAYMPCEYFKGRHGAQARELVQPPSVQRGAPENRQRRAGESRRMRELPEYDKDAGARTVVG